MLADYHLHTSMCGHAVGEIEEYVIAARRRGIYEIGFADHIPMYWLSPEKRNPDLAMSFDDLHRYIEEIKYLRKKYDDMLIWLGIEADYIPGMEKELGEVLARYKFDYVIGSVHYVDGWGYDNPKEFSKYETLDIDYLYSRYFKILKQAAGSGHFDIMAHPDLVKKFGFRSNLDMTGIYKETAGIFKDCGVWAELNSSGLRAPVQEVYPHPDFIKELKSAGVKFTPGSDAHSPGEVGEGIEEIINIAGEEMIARLKDKKQSGY